MMTPTKRRQAFLNGMIVVVQTLTFNIDSESLNKKKKVSLSCSLLQSERLGGERLTVVSYSAVSHLVQL